MEWGLSVALCLCVRVAVEVLRALRALGFEPRMIADLRG